VTPRFTIFGPAHLIVLAVTVALAAVLPWAVRRRPGWAWPARIGLVLALIAFTVAYLACLAREGPLSVWDVVPLHLCDFLILVVAFALLTSNRMACELLYFWGGTGTLLAIVTPDLGFDWPDWRFVVFFGVHGTVVVAASLVAFGLGRAPQAGAVRRVFLLTNVYAGAVAIVNAAWGKNFLYLCAKPSAPTVLDWFGPWPVYLVVVELVAAGLFSLLWLPFRTGAGARLRVRGAAG
jgi:hypothetical integral membrane protein (TIGR02206 family)